MAVRHASPLTAAAPDGWPGAEEPRDPRARPQVREREHRSASLDGVRGLAAASVVLLHLVSLFLGTGFTDFAWVDRVYRTASYTPLAALWAGGYAVTLFFALSGFVLHRMLLPGALRYPAYAARRVIRLWIPYAAAVVLALASLALFGSHPIAGQSEWLNTFLGVSPSAAAIAQHALMIGVFDATPFDFVIWSLVHEMRISLVFPLIFWIVQRHEVRTVLPASVLVGIAALYLGRNGQANNTSILLTLSYQTYFVIGAYLSKHESRVARFYQALAGWQRAGLFWLAVCLYCNCFRLSATYSPMLGCSWLIVACLGSARLQALLQRPVIQWLGRISYSLYLFHMVVLLGLINALHPRVAFAWIALASLPVMLVVAHLVNHWVERPSIRLSRRVARAAA